MRLKFTLILSCVMAFGADMCIALRTRDTNGLVWGQAIQGAQMSITVTNTALIRDAPLHVEAVITNSSTNKLVFVRVRGPEDFFLVLNNAAGTESHPIPPPSNYVMSQSYTRMKPGESSLTDIPLTVRKAIKPGNYTLKAVREFSVNHKSYKIESNSLNVQIQ